MSTINIRKSPLFRFTALTVLVSFAGMLPAQPSYAQVAVIMPPPGQMIHITRHFEPPQMVGLKVDLKDPFSFNFIMDQGEKPMSDFDEKQEFNKIIKYFLVSLAMPNKDMWVNLSPYESNRIVPEVFGQTEMGRDLLAQDYILKQFTASLMYPEDGLGKTFWNKVYSEAQARFGTTDINVNTFNKVWIVSDKADIYQKGDTALLVKSHLKVMLEQDFMAIEKNKEQFGNAQTLEVQGRDAKTKMASDIVRQIIIPAIQKEVNDGENFAAVRQAYNAEIMATWFKRTLRQSLLGQVFVDKSKTAGQRVSDPRAKEKIYQKYLRAYKKGVFNYIKEDAAPDGQMIPRKYFSGGLIAEPEFASQPGNSITIETPSTLESSPAEKAMVVNFARSVTRKLRYRIASAILFVGFAGIAGAVHPAVAEAQAPTILTSGVQASTSQEINFNQAVGKKGVLDENLTPKVNGPVSISGRVITENGLGEHGELTWNGSGWFFENQPVTVDHLLGGNIVEIQFAPDSTGVSRVVELSGGTAVVRIPAGAHRNPVVVSAFRTIGNIFKHPKKEDLQEINVDHNDKINVEEGTLNRNKHNGQIVGTFEGQRVYFEGNPDIGVVFTATSPTGWVWAQTWVVSGTNASGEPTGRWENNSQPSPVLLTADNRGNVTVRELTEKGKAGKRLAVSSNLTPGTTVHQKTVEAGKQFEQKVAQAKRNFEEKAREAGDHTVAALEALFRHHPKAPKAQAPAVQTPVAQAPAVQAPAVQAPAVQTPVAQAPTVQAPAEANNMLEPPSPLDTQKATDLLTQAREQYQAAETEHRNETGAIARENAAIVMERTTVTTTRRYVEQRKANGGTVSQAEEDALSQREAAVSAREAAVTLRENVQDQTVEALRIQGEMISKLEGYLRDANTRIDIAYIIAGSNLLLAVGFGLLVFFKRKKNANITTGEDVTVQEDQVTSLSNALDAAKRANLPESVLQEIETALTAAKAVVEAGKALVEEEKKPVDEQVPVSRQTIAQRLTDIMDNNYPGEQHQENIKNIKALLDRWVSNDPTFGQADMANLKGFLIQLGVSFTDDELDNTPAAPVETPPASVSLADMQTQLANLQGQLDEQGPALEQVSRDLEVAKKATADRKTYIGTGLTFEQKNEEVRALQAVQDAKQQEFDRLTSAVAELGRQIKELNAAIQTHIAEAPAGTPASVVKLATQNADIQAQLDQQGPALEQAKVELADAKAATEAGKAVPLGMNRNTIDKQRDVAALQAVQDAKQQEFDRLSSLVADLQRQKSELEDQVEQNNRLIVNTHSDAVINSNNDEVAKLEANVNKVREDLTAELSNAPNDQDKDYFVAKAKYAVEHNVSLDEVKDENVSRVDAYQVYEARIQGNGFDHNTYFADAIRNTEAMKRISELKAENAVIKAHSNEALDAIKQQVANANTQDEKDALQEQLREARAKLANAAKVVTDNVGGINLSDEHQTITIKVDGAGMPMPAQYQNAAMFNLNGLTSIIRKISPVTPENVPALYELVGQGQS